MTCAAQMEGQVDTAEPAEAPNGRSTGLAVVTVIIATLAETARADQLTRAIRSKRDGNDQHVEVLVVVNGDRYDGELVRELSSSDECRLVQLDQASFPRALSLGVDTSATPYFSFLDDDDEYLPGAVDLRLRTLEEHPDAALLVTNGYRRKGKIDHPAMRELDRVEADPLLALFRENWLPSCGGLFRRARTPDELFRDVPSLLEWTWIAFRIADAGGKVVVLNEPTFIINDTSGSQSASLAYVTSLPETLHLLRERTTRPEIRSALTRHLVQSLYAASSRCLCEGRSADAWRFHVQCLKQKGGWRYWKHTVRLLGFQRPSRAD
jgi:hypothetical protein